MEFAAGRVEGALRLLRAIMNQRAAVGMDHIAQTVGSDLSQRRVFVQFADDLSAQHPQVVDVLTAGTRSFSNLIHERGELSSSRQ